MTDKVFANFLARQWAEGRDLAEHSDILRLFPAPGLPRQQFIAEFHCRGVVQVGGRPVVQSGVYAVGIFFPSDYLRRASTPEVLTWLGPGNVHHPNIHGRAGAICIGRLVPGLSLVDMIYQVFEIIVYRKFNPREFDSLDPRACSWARRNHGLFPTDPRPLRRPGAWAAMIPAREGTAS